MSVVMSMNKETIFWMLVTITALASIGFLLGESDGDPPFSTADERHALANECIGSHDGGLAEHYHATVRISVHGEFISIPDDVGLNDEGCSMRPLHTHSGDGKIHIEMKEEGVEAPLEVFFDIWGKHMDSTGFDEYLVNETTEFLMFVTVDGNQEQVESFQNHVLADGQTIDLVFRDKA